MRKVLLSVTMFISSSTCLAVDTFNWKLRVTDQKTKETRSFSPESKSLELPKFEYWQCRITETEDTSREGWKSEMRAVICYYTIAFDTSAPSGTNAICSKRKNSSIPSAGDTGTLLLFDPKGLHVYSLHLDCE